MRAGIPQAGLCLRAGAVTNNETGTVTAGGHSLLALSEAERIEFLQSFAILDTEPSAGFDRITAFVAGLFEVPICLISLVDTHRQWFKSAHGLAVREIKREFAFCAHAIMQEDVMVVEDASVDERFVDNPLVTGEPYIRFYAGAPIGDPEGLKLGTVCIIDREPRKFSPSDRSRLAALAEIVYLRIQTHKTSRQTEIQQQSMYDLERENRLLSGRNENLQRYVGMIASDLKSAQGRMSELIDTLEQQRGKDSDSATPGNAHRLMDSATAISQQMSELIDSLSFNPSMRREQPFKTVSLEHVVDLVFRGSAGAFGHIEYQTSKLPTVRCVPSLLQQLFFNLVANAAEYRSKRPLFVRIAATEANNEIVITISDNGIGIDAARVGTIFDPPASKRESYSAGSGLGLAVCRQIVETHKGRIWCESQSGVGTTFFVALPKLQ